MMRNSSNRTKRGPSRGWILTLCAALALALAPAACSDDDITPPDQDSGKGNKDGGTDAKAGDKGVDGTSAPDAGVAAVKLVKDKAKVCPTTFQSTAPAAGKNTGFEVEAQKRTFYLRLPDSKSFAGPRPLMVYFHGTNGSGDEINGGRKTWTDVLLKKGFVVVGPEGEDNGTVWPEWDAMRAAGDGLRKNKDLLFFDALVDCLAAHLEIDKNRIYISGMSAGGIMANRVLRERSDLLAGGVVGSGIYELTDPATATSLKPMAVLVTWGGDNDAYTGTSGGKKVPEFNFAQQAALASQAYEAATGVDQIHCKGDSLGHKWLSAVEDLMVDYLLAHPEGMATTSGWKLKAPDASTKVTCSEDAAKYTPKVTVTCKKQTIDNCQVYCQSLGDCVVENGTVQPILQNEITSIGFTGSDQSECKGCVTNCEADATKGGAVDTTMLECYKTESAAKSCGTGITAAMAVADYINKCCKDQTKSEVCGRFCTAVMKNSVAAAFFTACAPWK